MDIESIKREIGLRIKSYRISKNLTQEQFCSIIELEQPNLSNIENGKTFPDITTLCAIINKSGIEPNYLFNSLYFSKKNTTSLDFDILSLLIDLPTEVKLKVKDFITLIQK